MKNKIIIPILSVILAAVAVGACENNENSAEKKEYETISGNIKVVAIDSCEYIISPVYAGYHIIHKQNCSFCKSREH